MFSTFLFLANAVLFMLLTMAWSHKDWMNIFFKFIFFVLAILNTLRLFEALGWTVRAVR